MIVGDGCGEDAADTSVCTSSRLMGALDCGLGGALPHIICATVVTAILPPGSIPAPRRFPMCSAALAGSNPLWLLPDPARWPYDGPGGDKNEEDVAGVGDATNLFVV